MESLTNGQTEIKGLLKDVREFTLKNQTKCYEHLIMEPAKDEYSFPRVFPVCAEKILGVRGEILTVVADIQSWTSKGFYNMRLWAAQGA